MPAEHLAGPVSWAGRETHKTQQAAIHFTGGSPILELVVVEVARWKLADGGVHAVLDGQPVHRAPCPLQPAGHPCRWVSIVPCSRQVCAMLPRKQTCSDLCACDAAGCRKPVTTSVHGATASSQNVDTSQVHHSAAARADYLSNMERSSSCAPLDSTVAGSCCGSPTSTALQPCAREACGATLSRPDASAGRWRRYPALD